MERNAKEDKYLSIPEFAVLIGITRDAVYKKVKKGEIEAIRIGRNYAIPQSAMVKILKGRLDESDKKLIEDVVEKTLSEYGESLRLLAKEDERDNDQRS